MPGALGQLYYRDAGATALDMLVGEGNYSGGDAEKFADLLLEDAGTLAVQDAHLWHADHEGVIDITGDGGDGLVQMHAADVDGGLEIELAVGDGRGQPDR